MLARLQHCGHEWESGLPEKAAGPPVSRAGAGETGWRGRASAGAVNWQRSPGGAGSSRGWPRASRWRGRLPRSAAWVAGNLGGDPLRASVSGSGTPGHGAHLRRRPRAAAPRPRGTGPGAYTRDLYFICQSQDWQRRWRGGGESKLRSSSYPFSSDIAPCHPLSGSRTSQTYPYSHHTETSTQDSGRPDLSH